MLVHSPGHLAPDIFDDVKIGWACRPPHYAHIVFQDPLTGQMRSVYRGIFLLKTPKWHYPNSSAANGSNPFSKIWQYRAALWFPVLRSSLETPLIDTAPHTTSLSPPFLWVPKYLAGRLISCQYQRNPSRPSNENLFSSENTVGTSTGFHWAGLDAHTLDSLHDASSTGPCAAAIVGISSMVVLKQLLDAVDFDWQIDYITELSGGFRSPKSSQKSR